MVFAETRGLWGASIEAPVSSRERERELSGQLAGKVAVITGGTSGIGEATVDRFVAEGAKVLIVGRNEAKGNALASTAGNAARFFRADVTREDRNCCRDT